MSSAAVTQGTALKLGFAGYDVTGFVLEDGLKFSRPLGEIEESTDTNGATLTKILMNPGRAFSLELMILDVGGSIDAPKEGDAFPIKDLGGLAITPMVVTADVTHNRGKTKLTVDLILEDSMVGVYLTIP